MEAKEPIVKLIKALLEIATPTPRQLLIDYMLGRRSRQIEEYELFDHDTFGIAVVEAMAAGLPVVVNDWPVMKEVCGDTASYFRSKDAEDCADAIEKLLAGQPQRKKMAEKNAEIVRKKYSIESYIETLAKIYENSSNR